MKKAVVVGSGAAGAVCAKELQGTFAVTILEEGNEFRPLTANLSLLEKLKKSGLFFDEREIRGIFPAMKIHRAGGRMILISGKATGGTTTISTGNAMRSDRNLKVLGIDLDEEFMELANEIPVSLEHQSKWRATTRRLFAICRDMNLDPEPTPKMGEYGSCQNCGRCVIGCPHGVKWDSRRFLGAAISRGARLLTRRKVSRVIIDNGRAAAVVVDHAWGKKVYPADLVILAAGGLGTPLILQKSGIACEPTLFVDPVLCLAAEVKGVNQNRELPMPFVVQKENFIISPYFDFLSFFFNRRWKYRAENICSLMIKLADTNTGSISPRGVQKNLTPVDIQRLEQAGEICREIFLRLGINKNSLFYGTINAGHPGGMLPLRAALARSFHDPRLPENLYVADASLFPASLGNPPILTIMAMAKRISTICKQLPI